MAKPLAEELQDLIAQIGSKLLEFEPRLEGSDRARDLDLWLIENIPQLMSISLKLLDYTKTVLEYAEKGDEIIAELKLAQLTNKGGIDGEKEKS